MCTQTTETVRVAKVLRREKATENIVVLELARDDAVTTPLPKFTAGAHIELLLDAGPRQYSICSAPSQPGTYRLAVLHAKEGRGGSKEIHDALQPGALIQYRGPFNHFPLTEDDAAPILIAGGIGITPILAMAYECLDQGYEFELHYAARTSENMAFAELFKHHNALAQRTTLYLSASRQRLELDTLLSDSKRNRPIYVCGPKRLIDAVQSAAIENGWAPDRINFEHFSNSTLEQSVDDNGSFTLQIQSTGQTIAVSPEQTAAEALMAAGINIPMSCSAGVCGTCRTRILEGVADHRDLFFSDAEKQEGEEFTPCCSRSKTPLLVLDL